MTIIEMLQQAGILSLLGMGMVLGFIITLVVVVSLLGKVIEPKSFKNDAKDSKSQKHTSVSATEIKPVIAASNPSAEGENIRITAAISAAINEYKKT